MTIPNSIIPVVKPVIQVEGKIVTATFRPQTDLYESEGGWPPKLEGGVEVEWGFKDTKHNLTGEGGTVVLTGYLRERR